LFVSRYEKVSDLVRFDVYAAAGVMLSPGDASAREMRYFDLAGVAGVLAYEEIVVAPDVPA